MTAPRRTVARGDVGSLVRSPGSSSPQCRRSSPQRSAAPSSRSTASTQPDRSPPTSGSVRVRSNAQNRRRNARLRRPGSFPGPIDVEEGNRLQELAPGSAQHVGHEVDRHIVLDAEREVDVARGVAADRLDRRRAASHDAGLEHQAEVELEPADEFLTGPELGDHRGVDLATEPTTAPPGPARTSAERVGWSPAMVTRPAGARTGADRPAAARHEERPGHPPRSRRRRPRRRRAPRRARAPRGARPAPPRPSRPARSTSWGRAARTPRRPRTAGSPPAGGRLRARAPRSPASWVRRSDAWSEAIGLVIRTGAPRSPARASSPSSTNEGVQTSIAPSPTSTSRTRRRSRW